MRLCTRHPHSTEERARKCRAKFVGKRGDRFLRQSGALTPVRYVQVRYVPPKVTRVGAVEVTYFYGV